MVRAGTDDYRAKLRQLEPGDTLILSSGTYLHGLPLHDIQGAPGAPIIITGADSTGSTVLMARPGANTISLRNAAYVTVRSLTLDGDGQEVDAVKAERNSAFAHHISLENLTIVNHGAHQQLVGISTKCPAWGWIIRDNVILGAGTGMYLGDSDGSAPFIDGLIERNVVIDSIGYNLQVKHQVERGDLAGAPAGPAVTLIRSNVFAKTANAAVGALARPSLLVGHFPNRGPGRDDKYRIVGNIFFENATEALLQGEGNVDLVANLFVTTRGDAVVFQPHHDVPRAITIARNFIAASTRGVLVTGGDPGATQEVAFNAIYADEPLRGGDQRGNAVGPFRDASTALERKLRSGELFRGYELAVFAERVCAAARLGRPLGTGSSGGAVHPACEFLRNLRRHAPG